MMVIFNVDFTVYGEDPAERRQTEARLAVGDATEDDLERLPQVAEAVVGAPPQPTKRNAAARIATTNAGRARLEINKIMPPTSYRFQAAR